MGVRVACSRFMSYFRLRPRFVQLLHAGAAARRRCVPRQGGVGDGDYFCDYAHDGICIYIYSCFPSRCIYHLKKILLRPVPLFIVWPHSGSGFDRDPSPSACLFL